MFLLVSVRHVGAHPGEHQQGVFIHFPDSGLYLLNGFDFDFDLFIMYVNILLLALAEIIMSEHG